MLTDRVKIQFLPPVPKSRPLSLPPLGVVLRAANQDTMIAGGNHTSVLCREAAKGVSSVALGCHHSSNNTPSVSLCSTAPPPGSRGPCCPRWGKCRVSGKGGVVGIFELVPFIGRHPLSQPLRAASSPFRGAFSRCPLWGKCREAAKGVSSVALGCYHSLSNTPSVSLRSTAPPLGSQEGRSRVGSALGVMLRGSGG